MKIVFTESGTKAITEYKDAQANLLVEQISARKYVFGDDVLEITASDVKEATERGNIHKLALVRRTPLRFVSQFYIILGASVIGASLFYDRIMSMINQNPNQLIMFFSGFVTLLTGLYFSMRARERELEQSRIQEIERRKGE